MVYDKMMDDIRYLWFSLLKKVTVFTSCGFCNTNAQCSTPANVAVQDYRLININTEFNQLAA